MISLDVWDELKDAEKSRHHDTVKTNLFTKTLKNLKNLLTDSHYRNFIMIWIHA